MPQSVVEQVEQWLSVSLATDAIVLKRILNTGYHC